MNKYSSIAAVLIAFAGAVSCGLSKQSSTQYLWPAGAPGALGDQEQDKPTLIVYKAKAKLATGTAVLIFPGGGYGHLAMDHEGHQIARWLNALGITGVICNYRHRGKGYGHPAPLQDAQRAIRTVRSSADKLNIKTDCIGVIGFSAGGHLASTVSTHFDSGDKESEDAVERQSCRPDFAILCYPVIAFGEPFTHKGSQNNLLGKEYDERLVAELSNEKKVTGNTPATFLWHTAEDKGVLPENSIQYFLALKSKGIPAELHIYQSGRHGLGLASKVEGTSEWPSACASWLRKGGFIPASRPQ